MTYGLLHLLVRFKHAFEFFGAKVLRDLRWERPEGFDVRKWEGIKVLRWEGVKVGIGCGVCIKFSRYCSQEPRTKAVQGGVNWVPSGQVREQSGKVERVEVRKWEGLRWEGIVAKSLGQKPSKGVHD
jgi:hypothetical protein